MTPSQNILFQGDLFMPTKIILAITGASGAIYGIYLLGELKKARVEIHLITSAPAKQIIEMETTHTLKELAEQADYYYRASDLAALPASGSFLNQGMVIAPCSMKTLSAIAQGYADNLIARAADVTIKEKRKLILLPRETPLSAIHLENMLKLARLGIIIMPPVPAFYSRPQVITDLVEQTTGRILDLLGIENSLVKRWPQKLRD